MTHYLLQWCNIWLLIFKHLLWRSKYDVKMRFELSTGFHLRMLLILDAVDSNCNKKWYTIHTFFTRCAIYRQINVRWFCLSTTFDIRYLCHWALHIYISRRYFFMHEGYFHIVAVGIKQKCEITCNWFRQLQICWSLILALISWWFLEETNFFTSHFQTIQTKSF